MRLVIKACLLLASPMLVSGCASLAAPVNPDRTNARVIHAVDGDTVTVRARGRTQDVRLLAIDTPEAYATRYGEPDECGSEGASDSLRRYTGARVTLVADRSQDDRDRYGRLLRYVVLEGGIDLGALQIRRGLAMPYAYGRPALRHARYVRLAQAARRSSRGSWAPPCDGDFHSSVPGVQNGL